MWVDIGKYNYDISAKITKCIILYYITFIFTQDSN